VRGRHHCLKSANKVVALVHQEASRSSLSALGRAPVRGRGALFDDVLLFCGEVLFRGQDHGRYAMLRQAALVPNSPAWLEAQGRLEHTHTALRCGMPAESINAQKLVAHAIREFGVRPTRGKSYRAGEPENQIGATVSVRVWRPPATFSASDRAFRNYTGP
jgi:hypothetical protein